MTNVPCENQSPRLCCTCGAIAGEAEYYLCDKHAEKWRSDRDNLQGRWMQFEAEYHKSFDALYQKYKMPRPETPGWMCTLCFPKWTELTMLGRGYSICVTEDGNAAIVGGQGHDAVLVFDKKPTPAPFPVESDDDPPAELAEVDNAWCLVACDCNTPFEGGIVEAHNFIENCIRFAGWDQSKVAFEFWLFDHVGKILANYEASHATD